MPQPKNQRPRIDAICNYIKRGTYDNEIGMLQEALDERKDALKAEIEARVKEIYGDGYAVQPKQNPFLKPPERQIPDGWTPDPDLAGPQVGAEPVLSEEGPTPLAPSKREREMEAEIETRGAIIGPLPE